MGDELWTVGYHAVLGVLESGRPVDVLWIQKDRRDPRIQRIRAAARSRGIRYDLVPRVRTDRVADGVAHNGCAVRSAPVAFVELADLIVVDGDPLEDIGVLVDPNRIHLVFRGGAAVAGTAQAPAL